MIGHEVLPLADLGWQATGFTSPAVYRVDVTCECGQGTTITAPGGPEVAFAAARSWHPWHLRVVDLEARLVAAFSGADLLPGSTLQLTERAAARMARLALDVFTEPLLAVDEPEEDSPHDE